MKKIRQIIILITTLFIIILFSNCAAMRFYNFSLQNTLSIFFLKNENNYYFSIPVQYIGDYQIEKFDFKNGFILIGDYKITLTADDLIISAYVNENSDEYGNTDGQFDLIYLKENGKVSISKMAEPLKIKQKSDDKMNQYNFIVDKNLDNTEIKNIISEYKKEKTNSQFYLEYEIMMNNEQIECGYLDNFELHAGLVHESSWFPPNLEFFRRLKAL